MGGGQMWKDWGMGGIRVYDVKFTKIQKKYIKFLK